MLWVCANEINKYQRIASLFVFGNRQKRNSDIPACKQVKTMAHFIRNNFLCHIFLHQFNIYISKCMCVPVKFVCNWFHLSFPFIYFLYFSNVVPTINCVLGYFSAHTLDVVSIEFCIPCVQNERSICIAPNKCFQYQKLKSGINMVGGVRRKYTLHTEPGRRQR